MLRAPLEALCLHIKILGHANVEEFLMKAIQVRQPERIQRRRRSFSRCISSPNTFRSCGFHRSVSFDRPLQPPSRTAVQHTMRGLRSIKALEEDEKQETLTPLGFHLASLPVDVRIGKMMLYGCIFRCLDPVLTIAAGMSLRSPFYAPLDKRDEVSFL